MDGAGGGGEAHFTPFALPDLSYLFNSLARKSWLNNLRCLTERVPADNVYPEHHSRGKKARCFPAGAGKAVRRGCFPRAPPAAQHEHARSVRDFSRRPAAQSCPAPDAPVTTEGLILSFLTTTPLPAALHLHKHPLFPSVVDEDYCPSSVSLLFQFTQQVPIPLSWLDRKHRGVRPSWPLSQIMLSQLQLFLSTSAGGRK